MLSFYMQFLESQYQLQNKVDHEKQCDKDDSGKQSKEFGINCNSSLNELNTSMFVMAPSFQTSCITY